MKRNNGSEMIHDVFRETLKFNDSLWRTVKYLKMWNISIKNTGNCSKTPILLYTSISNTWFWTILLNCVSHKLIITMMLNHDFYKSLQQTCYSYFTHKKTDSGIKATMLWNHEEKKRRNQISGCEGLLVGER